MESSIPKMVLGNVEIKSCLLNNWYIETGINLCSNSRRWRSELLIVQRGLIHFQRRRAYRETIPKHPTPYQWNANERSSIVAKALPFQSHLWILARSCEGWRDSWFKMWTRKQTFVDDPVRSDSWASNCELNEWTQSHGYFKFRGEWNLRLQEVLFTQNSFFEFHLAAFLLNTAGGSQNVFQGRFIRIPRFISVEGLWQPTLHVCEFMRSVCESAMSSPLSLSLFPSPLTLTLSMLTFFDISDFARHSCSVISWNRTRS